MNVIGVVGEFNPFHLGHLAHFEQSRALLGQTAPIVCVMSGDFVQRGEPACVDKHARAAMAVRCGADLVLELPLPWCIASAERFALGAVGLLDGLGFVTHLCFGSEAGQVEPLAALARAAADPENLARIKARMAEGAPFAAARQAVLAESLGPVADLLAEPNNILAVEYIKALDALGSAMTPVTTARTQSAHDRPSDGAVRSAGQLRAMLAAGEPVAPYMPPEAAETLARAAADGRGPVTASALDSAMMARLRLLGRADFCALPDATEGLGNRLCQAVRDWGTVSDVLEAVKTKRYPASRLRRMALCAALGIRADTGGKTPPYARLLGSTQRGRALLRGARMPVVTKPAAVKELGGEALEIFTLTANARDFYVLGYASPEERRGGSDWRAGPVTV